MKWPPQAYVLKVRFPNDVLVWKVVETLGDTRQAEEVGHMMIIADPDPFPCLLHK